MDVAYDHIQEEALSPEAEPATGTREQNRPRAVSGDLGTEFKEAYQAFSSSPWGARLGGFFGQVRKQGESYYEEARKEIDAASAKATAEASKGWTDLVSRTQALSTGPATQTPAAAEGDQSESERSQQADGSQSDFLKETEKFVSRFKTEGAARLKQIQVAEDAADDALERFGKNVTSWLKDAVTIAPPNEEAKSEILFESKDSEGKRIVHATRFDAQMHVIHSRLTSFMKDPESEEYKPWKASFDAEQKTDAIKKDLEKYDELRRAMEKLVPEQVSYPDFWCRYYFLRHIIETEEQKRRDLLKGAQTGDEEVAWDDDEEEEEDKTHTPAGKDDHLSLSDTPKIETQAVQRAETPTKAEQVKDSELLSPHESRRSNEHSVADSDASYDVVSGAPSRGPDTPKDEKAKSVAEQSDDDDWE